MHCKYCGFTNGEDDHRCLRCGRRVGTAVAAPLGYEGATALAPRLLPDEADPHSAEQSGLWALADQQRAPRLTQKVIPFTEIQRQAGIRPIPPPAAANETRAAHKPTSRKGSRPPAAQENFDFVPSAAPRTLKDAVEAQIYCDLPVATPIHRFVAGAMDAAMILIGFGLFLSTAWLMGQAMGAPESIFGTGRVLLAALAGSLGLIAIFYGLIWVMARRETAGMKWSDLQLVTFDGFPPDGSHRIIRYVATVMSYCSGGLGLLWALADAENLTWHDQISRTFPTVRTAHASFVRQPRRR